MQIIPPYIPLLIRDLAYFEDRSLVLRILFSLRVSFHGKVATQNLVKTSTNVLPPGHNPRSNTISTRILVYHNMRSRWWWWWWWWWVVVGGGGGNNDPMIERRLKSVRRYRHIIR